MYHGFQNQTNLPTVQGHIDKALEIISADASAFNIQDELMQVFMH